MDQPNPRDLLFIIVNLPPVCFHLLNLSLNRSLFFSCPLIAFLGFLHLSTPSLLDDFYSSLVIDYKHLMIPL